jgi:5-(aminomethyl)-3-furanmethanol phosphate kinase
LSIDPLTVVKIGGGLLAETGCLDALLTEIAAASRDVALLIVPGGGPFADTVRDLDRKIGLSDDAAHWMAVLAMDQYAHLIVARLPGGALVSEPGEIEAAQAAGRIPVLAPYQWLRKVDPLPHAWDVTSDSIAAWVAGQVGARRLVLVKPSQADGTLVDRYFSRALPSFVAAHMVPADRIDALRCALRDRRV